jgi:1,4-alpha-glucan branching enzyme
VAVSGDFNAWSPHAAPMRRQQNGQWETALVLQPGRYQYKFVADGQWLHDPQAAEVVPNDQGTLNSVIEVRP